MKRSFLLLLFVLTATVSFAQFVGSNSVGSSNQNNNRDRSFQIFKPHSDSYNSGLLLSAELHYNFDDSYLTWLRFNLGYRFNPYLYAGFGVHVDEGLLFPIELRAYLPLQNFSIFIGGFWGPTTLLTTKSGFEYPYYGGRVGVNRRFWALSFSVYGMPYESKNYYSYSYSTYYTYGESIYAGVSLEYSLPLKSIKQHLYK